MVTDIDRLHAAHGVYDGRRNGKTFYMCHSIVGQLETLQNGSSIVVLVPKYDYIKHFTRLLVEILEERGYDVVGFDQASKRLVIRGTDTTVKFISSSNSTIELRGFGVSSDQYVLYDYGDTVGELTVNEFYRQSRLQHGR